MSTPAEIFGKIAAAAEKDPESVTEVDTIYQFEVDGDNGGTFVLNLKKGVTEDFLSTEAHASPDITIKVTADDWTGMVSGKINAMEAFMGGKIKVEGNMALAMNLPKVLKLAR